MTKRTVFATVRVCIVLSALCLLLTGCGCKHEWVEAGCETPKTCSLCNETEGEALGHTWQEADCETPKTCSVCNITEGEALGHTWQEADCETPKTCSVCKKTEGEALGHTWVEATCETAKTCSVCNKTEGEVPGHTWQDATCVSPKTCSVCSKTQGEALSHNWADATTEAPQTCTVCQTTKGSRIVTDSRFKTSACKALFGTWKGTVSMPGSDLIDPNFKGTLDLEYTIIFNPDGTYSEKVVLTNEDSFTKLLEDYYAEMLYAEFALSGLSKEQADAAMKETYGMDTRAYAKVLSVAVDWNAMFAAANVSGVYYVANGTLYSGNSWNSYLAPDNYNVSDTSLTIETLSDEFPGLVLKRA